MTALFRFSCAALSALALSAALALPAAAADTVRASGNTRIFDGPGLRYAVIGVLRKDTRVTLDRCTRNSAWCLIEDRDGRPVGWVSGGMLIGIGAITRATPFRFLVEPDFVPNP